MKKKAHVTSKQRSLSKAQTIKEKQQKLVGKWQKRGALIKDASGRYQLSPNHSCQSKLEWAELRNLIQALKQNGQ
jgi:hypothetical protein